MSYHRFDDDYEEGKLTKFRERLSGAVRMHTGEKFEIFQDKEDIKWGEKFNKKIKLTLDEVMFLIPIITPGFFKSEYCREEISIFLKREQELNRDDLILPVLYVGCPVLNDPEKLEQDELAQNIVSRNWTDWRELRLEPPTSQRIAKRFDELALQIRDAIERGQTVKKIEVKRKPPKKVRKKVESFESDSSMLTSESKDRTPTPKNEPPTHIVDQMHRGDFATITEAIEKAKPGDRILIRPGHYKEGLVIDKPLELIGDGERDDIVIEAESCDAILFQTTIGRISNLTLRQNGGGNSYCVDISQGRLEIMDCDISSKSLACVAVHDGADPRIRNCIIQDGKGGGIYIYVQGHGIIEDNDIFGNAYSGVIITENSNPIIRRNRIHESKYSGILITEEGQGVIEDNDIFGNRYNGVGCANGGNPIVRNNRIKDNIQFGIRIYNNGKGTFENNELQGNKRSNWLIADDCKPNVKLSGNTEG